ncbi:MAG: hypothetical protein AAF391_05365 [Bacteroidota bacterium]
MRKSIIQFVSIAAIVLAGCETPKVQKMNESRFVEIVVQNHLVSHGFDEKNQEILEEVNVEKPRKKLIRLDRIQSVSEKYILTSYGYGRLVYWEYEGSYNDMKQLLTNGHQ